MKEIIREKIEKNKATIGIIGLGYVGLPLALSFAEVGCQVIGFDIDENKVAMLNKGESYIKHIEGQVLEKVVKKKLLKATKDFSKVTEVDAIILAVPTPLNKYREPDLSFVIKTLENILPFLKKGQFISLESTTYPGTTEEVVKPILESRGFTVGEDLFLVYSPEREDPGNGQYNTATIPKIIGGITEDCLLIGKLLYSKVINEVVPVSSTKTAELTKLLENIYRAVNIGLVNEMKIVADKMDIDIWEVINAAATKPFGFTPFYPGPGWGGHCIPIDPFYLTWKAREYGVNTRFIELAGEVNTLMPQWVMGKVMEGLNEKGKPLKKAKVLVLGLAYKKNIDDTRESPSVKIMELLREKGAIVYYSDPFVPQFPKMREHQFDLESLPITRENLQEMDCVLITTDHDSFDYKFILENSKLIIDTRGVYKGNIDGVIKA